jgi:hypothetical protein
MMVTVIYQMVLNSTVTSQTLAEKFVPTIHTLLYKTEDGVFAVINTVNQLAHTLKLMMVSVTQVDKVKVVHGQTLFTQTSVSDHKKSLQMSAELQSTNTVTLPDGQ